MTTSQTLQPSGCGGGGGLPRLRRLFLCGLLFFCDLFPCEFWSSFPSEVCVGETFRTGAAGSNNGAVAATATDVVLSTEVDILVVMIEFIFVSKSIMIARRMPSSKGSLY